MRAEGVHNYLPGPPRVEYSRTELGGSLAPVVEWLPGWGAAYVDEMPADSIGETANRRDVSARWGPASVHSAGATLRMKCSSVFRARSIGAP
ncbi:winged helix-turn-helix transcriptional regulator [Amycolatopsis marina]|uniref:winged helix-turn-helix transcriptional regulator n=1 Tax=Amycolatopsis marina TaxID=490629 RepID=UPI000B8A545E